MAGAFQTNAYQNNAYQVYTVAPVARRGGFLPGQMAYVRAQLEKMYDDAILEEDDNDILPLIGP